MTAVAYCMRDLHGSGNAPPGAVYVPQSSGGCGVPHEAKKTGTGRWVIECDDCAPRLIAKTYGFSSDAAGVPLTPDEVRANELAERDGKAAPVLRDGGDDRSVRPRHPAGRHDVPRR